MALYYLSAVCRILSICLVYSHIASGQANWTDCVANEFADPIFVHSLVISPLPILLPGTYNVSFDASVSSYIDEFVVDVAIGWKNVTSGDTEKVYPIEADKYLRVYDACYVINKILFSNPDAIDSDLDVQIDQLLVSALNYHAGCPFLVGRVKFNSLPVELPVNLIAMNALPKDRYVVKVMFRNTRDEDLGCIQFHVTYEGQVIN